MEGKVEFKWYAKRVPMPVPCGIYLIRNTVSGGCYVGQAIDFKNRWTTHVQDLKHHRHNCDDLQAGYDEHGIQSLEFRVLEGCGPDEMDRLEWWWMVKLRANLANALQPRWGKIDAATPEEFEAMVPSLKDQRWQRVEKPKCACGANKQPGNRCCRRCMYKEKPQWWAKRHERAAALGIGKSAT